jgi:Spy/CpxP family protein refolding chaperone
MKKFTGMAICLLLVASATWAMAGPLARAGWGGDAWCPGAAQLSALNLSTEQSEKVRGLRESFIKETTPIRNELFTKRAEVRLLWMQTKPDADKIRATQKEIHDLMGQMQEKAIDSRLAFRSLLTPEQTSQLLAQDLGRGPGAKWGRGSHSADDRPGRGQGRGQDYGPGGCPRGNR